MEAAVNVCASSGVARIAEIVSVAKAYPELAEKLNKRQGILRPTPHQRIMTAIRCGSKVRAVSRVEVTA
ncbi:hypothetical protein NECAME_00189 [Necator americanus]|uniref:Uncharacterized protein n=1 Tax=Necator americanus TaxID=51031 RepID=W2TJP9_NECAM|nr:hypothetical protein NECAME_00189 [Necator americanus]ETN81839.1 hypothetical protein NECAME_00189 [Necator americanus]